MAWYASQRKHKLTIPLSVFTNIATFQTSSGLTRFEAFCAEAGFEMENEDELPLFLYEANMISNRERAQ
eukprot:scaffold421280_cov72-Attheya_sp.AAC.3